MLPGNNSGWERVKKTSQQTRSTMDEHRLEDVNAAAM
jgi:hypothetical protein